MIRASIHNTATPPPGGVGVSASLLAMIILALGLTACTADSGPGGNRAEGAMIDDDTAAEQLSIRDIQGDGERSPRLGRSVTVRGVVNGNFLRGLGGVFIQDASEDGAPAAGLFLRPPEDSTIEPAPLRRGDLLEVSGVVDEFGRQPATLTGLRDAKWRVISSGHRVATLRLDAPPPSWEALEGASVRIDAPLTVNDNGGLQKYGELTVAFGGRLFQPTEVARPGAEADAIAADNQRRSLVLDDNRNRQFPNRIWYLDGPLDNRHPLRAGSVIQGVSGVIDQRHGRYRLQLEDAPERITQAPRPAAPKAVGNPGSGPGQTLRIAAFNVLSLFNGNGRGRGFPTPRGASSPNEYRRQLDKLVAAISAVKPDILALMELENDGGGKHSSQADLIDALNAALVADGESGDYRAAFLGKGPGRDVIRVALLFRDGRVQAVGKALSIGDGPFEERSRAPLAQAFRAGDAAPFVVAVNHFKSKGGCDEADGDNRDRGDGQGCWSALRVQSAQRLARWLGTDPAGIGSERTLIVGDLNSYSQEDPIIALEQAGYVDVFRNHAEPDYSFIWGGASGRLDHALASPALAADVVAATHWHINADESVAFDYQTENRSGSQDAYRPDPFRSSDHDPLIIDLRP
ncbi:MAG: ExeM/NucH family extracellular endonuclease [Xanthomonadales bacterium]|nr:ExeM/NucH family extracellular endonuclease [Xanthomonadales bacterium]